MEISITRINFEKFISPRQGDLAVDEYVDQFAKLVCLCELKESDMHNSNRFSRGLKPNLVENMKDCKDIFQAYKEAICVEYMFGRFCLQKSKSQKGKSQKKITEAHVVKPITENVKADIEQQKQAEEFKYKGPKFPSLESVDHQYKH